MSLDRKWRIELHPDTEIWWTDEEGVERVWVVSETVVLDGKMLSQYRGSPATLVRRALEEVAFRIGVRAELAMRERGLCDEP